MGRRFAEFDWAGHPLGDPAGWPAAVRAHVSAALASRFPTVLWLGDELRLVYNDAYLPMLGDKHPAALGSPGAEVWWDIWDMVGPMLARVADTGVATWSDDLMLVLVNEGRRRERYFTFTYSPMIGGNGRAEGVFCAVSETTERVLGERRLQALNALAAALLDLSSADADAVLAAAIEVCAAHDADLPFAAVYLADGPPGRARPHQATSAVAGLLPPALAPLLEGASLSQDGVRLAGGLPSRLPGLADRFADGWCPEQALVIPVAATAGAGTGAVLVLGLNCCRPLDEQYWGFCRLVADQVSAALATARAHEDERRRAEALAELDRAKTTFFANISHEFRTPLTLIMGPVAELQRRLAGAGPQVREELEVIGRNGLRLSRLVNTLLDFSRIQAGRMQARYGPADLAQVTAELASVFRSAVGRAGLAFEVDCPPLPEPVYLDRDMWEKVVLNLLSNALKFTFEGSIRIAVRAEGGQAVVTVADTGTGIPEHEMPRLFERFHRIENARSRSTEGSGIGLALVRELVQLHGGTITASSSEGEGTTFTIRLPFGQAHLPAGAVVPAGPAAAVSATADPFVQEALRWLPGTARDGDDGTGPRPPHEEITPGSDTGAAAESDGGLPARVLVADDNADMREYLARLLRTAGYQVTMVADGQAALDAARADPPDLVISDVMMPRLDGMGLVAALRARERTAAVPVLLLSARAGQEASIEGLRAGADDYLVKPFSAAELLARARARVELARLRSHHARWRAALVDSLQDAFFVCDHDGTITEINSAFTGILGYGPEGLPYRPPHPWWPAAETDPEAYGQVTGAFAQLLDQSRGRYTVPVTHRDGHRVWTSAAFSQVHDPGTGHRMIVGTFRDVTAEHDAARRDAALADLSMRLSRAEDLAGAVAGALDELQQLWRAARVLAAVFPGPGPPQIIATGPGTPGLDWENLPATYRRALTGLRTGPPLTPAADGGAGAGIALDHPAGTLAVWIDLGGNRSFTGPDQALLTALACRLGQGLQRVHQLDQQRETALALQRAILGPAQLPPGFAARYEPAARPLKVGGDWYDTVALPGDRIGIVVGDCVGHDLHAATIMGQLRSACRALLLQHASPAPTLQALDRFAVSIPGAAFATVFCAVLDPATGQLAYSSAGHPPAILARPDGTTELLEQAQSAPLAIDPPGTPRPETGHTLPARSALLLYTDGLVERRHRPLDDGITDAAQVLHDGRALPAGELATRLMTQLAPPSGYEDDVALLLYRHPAPPQITFPAKPASPAPCADG